MIPRAWRRKCCQSCHRTTPPEPKNLITTPWEHLSKVFSIIVTSCPLTRHSDASLKGSRGTHDTAPTPYNGILAPRETHSEILTILRRSVLRQLLPRQRICPVEDTMEDRVCPLGGMEYWSWIIFWDISICELGYLDYAYVKSIFWAGLYLLLVHTRGCINVCDTTIAKLNTYNFIKDQGKVTSI